jgi:hypothetical protein
MFREAPPPIRTDAKEHLGQCQMIDGASKPLSQNIIGVTQQNQFAPFGSHGHPLSLAHFRTSW